MLLDRGNKRGSQIPLSSKKEESFDAGVFFFLFSSSSWFRGSEEKETDEKQGLEATKMPGSKPDARLYNSRSHREQARNRSRARVLTWARGEAGDREPRWAPDAVHWFLDVEASVSSSSFSCHSLSFLFFIFLPGPCRPAPRSSGFDCS